MAEVPFLEDIYPRNLLYAVTIRSPIAKGKLISIQTPELPNNFLLITAKDIPGENKLEDTGIPILADQNLSYIGEPAAILLGHDKVKLEELAARCKVIAEEETPVFSCGDDNEAAAVKVINIGSDLPVYEHKGNIVTGSFSTGIQEHFYAEPIGAVTWYDDDDGLTKKNKKQTDDVKSNKIIVRTATQWPFHVKRSVTCVLGIDGLEIYIEPTALNLHMDGKLWYPSLIACHAALGTFITKKPVRLILNKEDDFLYTPKRFSSNIDIVSSVDKSGNIIASNINISVNLGSYQVNKNEILDQICLGCLGMYKFDNISLTAKAYKTNLPPQDAFSGFGLAQGSFAIEQHVSHIADMSNIDPAIWRINNADPKIILPLTSNTAKLTHIKMPVTGEELIGAVIKLSDYYRKWTSNELLRQSRKGKSGTIHESGRTYGTAPNSGNCSLNFENNENPRGIGIAIGYQGSGLLYPSNNEEDKGIYSVEVTLTKESIIEIKASITTSEDYNKIWEKVVLETMSIKSDMVRIDTTDSANSASPDCGPSCSSRNITAVTRLVEKCCIAISKQRFHDPLPITVRRSFKPQPGSFRGGALEVSDINGFVKPGLAAAVVEVAINLSECVPVVRGIWLAIDGGKIISKNRALRSIKRSATQALGWAFTEHLEYINGALPKSQYNNFSIFSPIEIPPVYIEFLESGAGDPKGIGDLPFTCIPAAFTQAVSQAMDHCFKSIPLERNDIWEMYRLRDEKIQEPAPAVSVKNDVPKGHK